MRKIRFGTIEILGYVGLFVWLSVILLRDVGISDNTAYTFLLGVLPNLGAAWLATLVGKWVVVFALKKDMSTKIHLLLCFGVFVLALLSEVIHDMFLDSPFDLYDIIITFVAQVVVFFLPIVTKDKYFANYTQRHKTDDD